MNTFSEYMLESILEQFLNKDLIKKDCMQKSKSISSSFYTLFGKVQNIPIMFNNEDCLISFDGQYIWSLVEKDDLLTYFLLSVTKQKEVRYILVDIRSERFISLSNHCLEQAFKREPRLSYFEQKSMTLNRSARLIFKYFVDNKGFQSLSCNKEDLKSKLSLKMGEFLLTLIQSNDKYIDLTVSTCLSKSLIGGEYFSHIGFFKK